MNLLTKTLSPTSRVGTMLLEGIQKASKTNGRTKPKTRAKAMRRMTKNSTNPFLVFGGECCCPCWSSLGNVTLLQALLGTDRFRERLPLRRGHDRRHREGPPVLSGC